MTTACSIALPSSRRKLSDHELRGAFYGVQKHAGRSREWRPNDTATMAEYCSRAWNWARVEGLKMIGTPRCVENACYAISSSGRRMTRAIWRPVIGVVCAAYRAGTTGVRLSLEQIAVLLGSSRSTAGRVLRELQANGLIKVQHTYKGVPGERERMLDTSILEIGPALLLRARGGLEAGDNATRYAAAARSRARKERRARYISLWETQRGTHTLESPRSEGAEGAPAPDLLGGSPNVGPTPLKIGGHTLPDPPGSGEAKDRPASVAAAPLPAWLPPANRTAKPAAPGGSSGRRGRALEGLHAAGQNLSALARAARAAYFPGGGNDVDNPGG